MRVAVVGTCASGKSSIVSALRERGVDAYAVGQEHSAIPELWRHQDPDRLVVLEASLATIRRRRNDPSWPKWIYNVQRERLANARQHADAVVETDNLTIEQVVEQVITQLGAKHEHQPGER